MKKKHSKKQKAAESAHSYFAKIKVVGVGGGGGNAVSRMYEEMGVRGVEFIAINADAQDLDNCSVKRKVYIGKNLTKGLGTGMNPDLGRQAAEENRGEIADALKGADLVFVTAGLGGGCGSGAGPFVAEIAREQGALTIGVVTKPFTFEGAQRNRIAQEAFIKMKEKVDTIISVPNDRIFSIIKKDTPIIKAFMYIDEVLRNAVEGIAELIGAPGIVNVDFADVKAVMANAGPALVGVGVAGGTDRALQAVNLAINSPLLEVSLEGAKGVLFGVSGGRDLRMLEINDIAKVISTSIDPTAKVIFGAYYDRRLPAGKIKVTVVATGFNGQMMRDPDALPTLFGQSSARGQQQINANTASDEETSPSKVSSDKKSSSPPKAGSEKEEKEVWDIPTFLRKKRR